MKISQKRQLDRFKRSLEFVDKHAKDFAPGARLLSAREELRNVIAQAESNAGDSTQNKTGRRVYRSDKLVALNALRAQLGRVARTAAIIEKQDPDFDNKFQMPDKRRKDELAQAAHHFIEELPKVSHKFKEFEMGEDDVKKLQSALDEYEKVQSTPATKPERSPRSASSNPVIDNGIELLNTLDTIMHNKYDGNAELLGNWEQISTLEVTRRKRKGGKTNDAND